MIAGISKKVIFASLLFLNCIQPSKTADLDKTGISGYKNHAEKSSLKIFKTRHPKSSSNLSSKDKFKKIFFDKKLSNKSESLFTFRSEKQNEVLIQSDKQSEINDVIYAEGNVSLSFRGKLLKADNLT